MTIKRRWTDGKGIAREKVLMPGYQEKATWQSTDPIEAKTVHFIDGTVKVITKDTLEFKHKRRDSIKGETAGYKMVSKGQTVELQGDWSLTLAKQEINSTFGRQQEDYEEKIISRGHKDRDVVFIWEPTLPLSSRK